MPLDADTHSQFLDEQKIHALGVDAPRGSLVFSAQDFA
jgi:hypothetical protein